jgi:hypothetical protein
MMQLKHFWAPQKEKGKDGIVWGEVFNYNIGPTALPEKKCKSGEGICKSAEYIVIAACADKVIAQIPFAIILCPWVFTADNGDLMFV